jgi:coenzyme F420-reducing hydrogenase gamma subunit
VIALLRRTFDPFATERLCGCSGLGLCAIARAHMWLLITHLMQQELIYAMLWMNADVTADDAVDEHFVLGACLFL